MSFPGTDTERGGLQQRQLRDPAGALAAFRHRRDQQHARRRAVAGSATSTNLSVVLCTRRPAFTIRPPPSAASGQHDTLYSGTPTPPWPIAAFPTRLRHAGHRELQPHHHCRRGQHQRSDLHRSRRLQPAADRQQLCRCRCRRRVHQCRTPHHVHHADGGTLRAQPLRPGDHPGARVSHLRQHLRRRTQLHVLRAPFATPFSPATVEPLSAQGTPRATTHAPVSPMLRPAASYTTTLQF